MEEIVWEGGVDGKGLPIFDVDIAYNKIFDKFEIVAFDKAGQMMVQKYGQWVPGVKNQYFFPVIDNKQTGKHYMSGFGASLEEASYETGFTPEHCNKPEFCFSKSTEKILKKQNIKLDLQELINFGVGVVKQYAKKIVMRNIESGTYDNEEEVSEYLEQRDYVKRIKHELNNKKESSTVYTLDDLNEQKETLAELKKEFDNFCELKTRGFIESFTNGDKNLEIDEERELDPTLFAKTIRDYEQDPSNTYKEETKEDQKVEEIDFSKMTDQELFNIIELELDQEKSFKTNKVTGKLKARLGGELSYTAGAAEELAQRRNLKDIDLVFNGIPLKLFDKDGKKLPIAQIEKTYDTLYEERKLAHRKAQAKTNDNELGKN